MMWRDAGRCPCCGARLRWESMPGSAGYWALYHGDHRLGMAIFDHVLDAETRTGYEAAWPDQWHRRETREDAA